MRECDGDSSRRAAGSMSQVAGYRLQVTGSKEKLVVVAAMQRYITKST